MNAVFQAILDRQKSLDEAIRKGVVSGEGAYLLGNRYAWTVGKEMLGIANTDAVGDNVVDDSEKSIWFTVTSINEDRDGDVVMPMGIEVANFSRYAPWFLNHVSHGVPIGRGTSPDGQLGWIADQQRARAKCYFDPADPQAMFIFEKYKSGFMRATSVSFMPIVAERREREEKAIQSHQAMPGGWLFSRVELTEISLVGLGSNRDALTDELKHARKHLTPQFCKVFYPFCAQPKGKSFSGWCPCQPCEKSGKEWPDSPEFGDQVTSTGVNGVGQVVDVSGDSIGVKWGDGWCVRVGRGELTRGSKNRVWMMKTAKGREWGSPLSAQDVQADVASYMEDAKRTVGYGRRDEVIAEAVKLAMRDKVSQQIIDAIKRQGKSAPCACTACKAGKPCGCGKSVRKGTTPISSLTASAPARGPTNFMDKPKMPGYGKIAIDSRTFLLKTVERVHPNGKLIADGGGVFESADGLLYDSDGEARAAADKLKPKKSKTQPSAEISPDRAAAILKSGKHLTDTERRALQTLVNRKRFAMKAKLDKLAKAGYNQAQSQALAESLWAIGKRSGDISGHEEMAKALYIRKYTPPSLLRRGGKAEVTAGPDKGQTGTIVDIKQGEVTLKLDNGGTIKVDYAMIEEKAMKGSVKKESQAEIDANLQKINAELGSSGKATYRSGRYRIHWAGSGHESEYVSLQELQGALAGSKSLAESNGTAGGYATGDKMNDEPEAVEDKAEAAEFEGVCPECGGAMEDGVCAECGYTAAAEEPPPEEGKQKPDEPTDALPPEEEPPGQESKDEAFAGEETPGEEAREEGEENEAMHEEEAVALNSDPALAPPGAILHAKMIAHHQKGIDMMDKEMMKLEPETRVHFQEHSDMLKGLHARHKADAMERYPEHDMDGLAKALEGSAGGEAGLVAEGDTPPPEEAPPEQGDGDTAAEEIVDRYLGKGKRNDVKKEVKISDLQVEGNEVRYQGKRVSVFLHPPTQQNLQWIADDLNGKHKSAKPAVAKSFDSPHKQCMKDASDYMADLSDDEGIPAKHKGGLKYHSGALAKALSEAETDPTTEEPEEVIPKEVADELEKTVKRANRIFAKTTNGKV